nr:hypothetical protein CFP56_32243 [Quercus suber]
MNLMSFEKAVLRGLNAKDLSHAGTDAHESHAGIHRVASGTPVAVSPSTSGLRYDAHYCSLLAVSRRRAVPVEGTPTSFNSWRALLARRLHWAPLARRLHWAPRGSLANVAIPHSSMPPGTRVSLDPHAGSLSASIAKVPARMASGTNSALRAREISCIAYRIYSSQQQPQLELCKARGLNHGQDPSENDLPRHCHCCRPSVGRVNGTSAWESTSLHCTRQTRPNNKARETCWKRSYAYLASTFHPEQFPGISHILLTSPLSYGATTGKMLFTNCVTDSISVCNPLLPLRDASRPVIELSALSHGDVSGKLPSDWTSICNNPPIVSITGSNLRIQTEFLRSMSTTVMSWRARTPQRKRLEQAIATKRGFLNSALDASKRFGGGIQHLRQHVCKDVNDNPQARLAQISRSGSMIRPMAFWNVSAWVGSRAGGNHSCFDLRRDEAYTLSPPCSTGSISDMGAWNSAATDSQMLCHAGTSMTGVRALTVSFRTYSKTSQGDDVVWLHGFHRATSALWRSLNDNRHARRFRHLSQQTCRARNGHSAVGGRVLSSLANLGVMVCHVTFRNQHQLFNSVPPANWRRTPQKIWVVGTFMVLWLQCNAMNARSSPVVIVSECPFETLCN